MILFCVFLFSPNSFSKLCIILKLCEITSVFDKNRVPCCIVGSNKAFRALTGFLFGRIIGIQIENCTFTTSRKRQQK